MNSWLTRLVLVNIFLQIRLPHAFSSMYRLFSSYLKSSNLILDKVGIRLLGMLNFADSQQLINEEDKIIN